GFLGVSVVVLLSGGCGVVFGVDGNVCFGCGLFGCGDFVVGLRVLLLCLLFIAGLPLLLGVGNITTSRVMVVGLSGRAFSVTA
ncbi:hypothetical protein, partial [Pseudomonas syringae group genomosp. 7]|uniref:hypothetical protein n=1 Tax=Pseudomonas syringae group genomosp. 7 TaxID=251699 RepID=UPI00376F6740